MISIRLKLKTRVCISFSVILLFSACQENGTDYNTMWNFPCEKSETISFSLENYTLVFSQNIARQANILQTPAQRSTNQESALCLEKSAEAIDVASISFTMRDGYTLWKNDGEFSLPPGVTHLHIKSGDKPLKAQRNCTDMQSQKSVEICRFNLPMNDRNLIIIYDIHFPKLSKSKQVTTHGSWPYTLYPEETWQSLSEEILEKVENVIL